MRSFKRHGMGAVLLALSGIAAASPSDNCPPPVPVPAAVEAMLGALMTPGAPRPALSAADGAAMKAYETAQTRNDWAQLCRYRKANGLLPPSDARVVFLGASTTEFWGVADPDFFRGNVVNRGIAGQTTQQLLLRFQQDVLALKPRVLHLMASSNDIRAAAEPGGFGIQTLQDAIVTMVTLAQSQGITVVLASNFPTSHMPWAPELKPASAIIQYNGWLKDFAASRQLAFVDYHAVLRDDEGGMQRALTNDGVHPNRDGYARVTPIARAAIAKALAGTAAR